MKYLFIIFLWDYQLANSHADVSFGVAFQNFSSTTKHLLAGYFYSISASTISPRWEKVLSLTHSLTLFCCLCVFYVHSFK